MKVFALTILALAFTVASVEYNCSTAYPTLTQADTLNFLNCTGCEDYAPWNTTLPAAAWTDSNAPITNAICNRNLQKNLYNDSTVNTPNATSCTPCTENNVRDTFCAEFSRVCGYNTNASAKRYADEASCKSNFTAAVGPVKFCIDYHLNASKGAGANDITTHCPHAAQVELCIAQPQNKTSWIITLSDTIVNSTYNSKNITSKFNDLYKSKQAFLDAWQAANPSQTILKDDGIRGADIVAEAFELTPFDAKKFMVNVTVVNYVAATVPALFLSGFQNFIKSTNTAINPLINGSTIAVNTGSSPSAAPSPSSVNPPPPSAAPQSVSVSSIAVLFFAALLSLMAFF